MRRGDKDPADTNPPSLSSIEMQEKTSNWRDLENLGENGVSNIGG